MVELNTQYQRLKDPIDKRIQGVIDSSSFINGPEVKEFESGLASYLGVNHVIGCANGTDALQISLMALDFEKGDEIIIPAFTYAATAEVIGLLGLTPVMVDVCYDTFNIDVRGLENAITPQTKAIIPVHLFGQVSDMRGILDIASNYNLKVIEDNAQAIGANYTNEGETVKTGTIGDIGCTSFFPSKNLGCFGDGGAIFTNDDELASKIRIISNHGQSKKYYHSLIGVNSRLDSMQAAVLNVKLAELDDFAKRRQEVAKKYDLAFSSVQQIQIPKVSGYANNVYHQYTIKVPSEYRDSLKEHLMQQGIPSMIYYPLPLYAQDAFKGCCSGEKLPVTERLCKEVLSLPIHTEMDPKIQDFIINEVKSFFEK